MAEYHRTLVTRLVEHRTLVVVLVGLRTLVVTVTHSSLVTHIPSTNVKHITEALN